MSSGKQPGRPRSRFKETEFPHRPDILPFILLLLQALRSSLLPQVQSAPSSVLEELKLRLHLKDGLFQEVLADRAQQAQEHQEQVQELLSAISARDQYIQVDPGASCSPAVFLRNRK